MKTSKEGIDLIKKFESCRLKAYRLAGEKYYTIGWGHSGPDVTEGMTITAERADELLRQDLARFEGYVERYCRIPLTENRNAALVSYTYNRGPGGMKQIAANCHTVEEYSAGLVKYWGKATRYKDALVRRRKAEQALFDRDIPRKSNTELASEVIKGLWGSGEERKKRLKAAGYDPAAVQKEVNKLMK